MNTTGKLMHFQIHACYSNSTVLNSESEGIDVYVLDSGINVGHLDFEGRASTEISFVSDEEDDDFGGHGKYSRKKREAGTNRALHSKGTHVAGKIGGRQYGVAKGVKLHAVKILDKSGVGTTSGLIRGRSIPSSFKENFD